MAGSRGQGRVQQQKRGRVRSRPSKEMEVLESPRELMIRRSKGEPQLEREIMAGLERMARELDRLHARADLLLASR